MRVAVTTDMQRAKRLDRTLSIYDIEANTTKIF